MSVAACSVPKQTLSLPVAPLTELASLLTVPVKLITPLPPMVQRLPEIAELITSKGLVAE
ncbi:hypothetical protein QE250_15970 [Chromatiaceae bacterium AAb-1]|nr:hypothetical protein [Chromatiaceae bacterium AAb-1]